MVRFGYACINMTLQKQFDIQTSRGMKKKTFEQKGITYASELALKNCKDLSKVIQWNVENNVEVFRVSSSMFPWSSEYELAQLPDYEEIAKSLAISGSIAQKAGQRLSFHPGPFNILSSEKENVIKNTIKELHHHQEVMDLMGLPANHNAKINIHVGSASGNRNKALDTWCRNFDLLNERTKSRLSVENDDKENLYSIKMLYDGVFKKTKVPIVADILHHECGPKDLSWHDALHLAASTWGDIVPTCHLSNTKQLEDEKSLKNAHSDYIYSKFEDCSLTLDVVIEAKMKELALLAYKTDFTSSK